MIKGTNQRKKKIIRRSLIILILAMIFAGVGYYFFQEGSEPVDKVEASDVIGPPGDFRLTAENRWDNTVKRNYAQLNWENVPELTQSGYRLFQSEDGNIWNNRSLLYGKSIKVLNVYPDTGASNTLKGWMDGLGMTADDGMTNLIQVTPVAIADFNVNPDSQLKDASGNYKYDVIMFGSWDSNYNKDISEEGGKATTDFILSGRGVLFGHDTIYKRPNNQLQNWYKYFFTQNNFIGVGHDSNMEDSTGRLASGYRSGSEKVKVLNDGYLMKFPFELPNGVILDIPLAHSVELSSNSMGIVWAEFIEPLHSNFPNPIYRGEDWSGGWYLKTNNNIAMIQTGHSQGRSTEDERKIIANVLYNLAQVSLENNASDYSVIDDKAPNKPKLDARHGNRNKLDIRVDAKDLGKKYQWYVQADTRTGVLKSDTVEEEIVSNIAGYFYRIVSDPNSSDYKTEIENKKDQYGRIPEEQFTKKVNPGDNSVSYPTDFSISIDKTTDSGKYIQVIAVDRMSNVSDVTTIAVEDLVPRIGFEVERTGDEAKLVELNLVPEMDQSMEVLEVRVPKNLVINPGDLPTNWSQYQTIEGTNSDSIIFIMGNNNSSTAILDFLKALRFNIGNPVNQQGEIEVLFYENLKETVEVRQDNFLEYFSLISQEDTGAGFQGTIDSHYDPDTGILTYTRDEDFKMGGFYLRNRISFEEDFRFEGRINLGNKNKAAGGADGVGFLLHPGSARTLGKWAGYLGVGGIPNGIGFVMDTYHNTVEDIFMYPDPPIFRNQSYGALVRNEGERGKRKAYMGADAPGKQIPDPANNTFRDFVMEYTHTNHTLTVRYNNDNNLVWTKDISDWLVEGANSYAFSSQGATGSATNLQQIEIRNFTFTEVTEFTEESIGDVSFSATIPQKIFLKGYDDSGGALSTGDILEDQKLRIGKSITVQPKVLEFYSFIEAQEMDSTPRSLSYTVSSTYQEGKLIYSLRRANMHIRQVIQSPNDELVVPKEGYLTIQNQLHNSGNPVLDTNYQVNMAISSGMETDNPDFTTFVVSTTQLTNDNDEVQLSAIIPEFYKYNGYKISDTLAAHDSAPLLTDAKISLTRLAIYNQGEYWITIYLEPNGTNDGKPQPYSWDYKKNNLGKIKTSN
ncbi:hypothetical protein JZO70_21765 [Enterococcus sp. 669A]|uniref:DUF5057 domain-containing protein n=1 Tax=Candidatus Enterococcus moelleringii TaxID=2815325 RepID=A0ABS3LGR5_9ENTE|nr:L-type lectin-domain containing protein [Enterococcus sp. 669A]MBO1308815.1 hypothetical protein [Enterococcus sp. 669A]